MVTAEREKPIVDLDRHLILGDYRHGHIPTYTGLHHSQEWVDRMRLISKGRIKSTSEIENRSHIWNTVRKILERDRTIPYSEIVDITSFTLQQVENTIHNHYKSPKALHPIPPFTQQERKERRKRAKANIRLSQRPSIPYKEKENRQFAQLLLESPIITDDLTSWNIIHALSKKNNIPLPESFARRLILEAFITAVIRAQKGKRKLMNKYLALGRSVNSARFSTVPIPNIPSKPSSSRPINIDLILEQAKGLERVKREKIEELPASSRR